MDLGIDENFHGGYAIGRKHFEDCDALISPSYFKKTQSNNELFRSQIAERTWKGNGFANTMGPLEKGSL